MSFEERKLSVIAFLWGSPRTRGRDVVSQEGPEYWSLRFNEVRIAQRGPGFIFMAFPIAFDPSAPVMRRFNDILEEMGHKDLLTYEPHQGIFYKGALVDRSWSKSISTRRVAPHSGVKDFNPQLET